MEYKFYKDKKNDCVYASKVSIYNDGDYIPSILPFQLRVSKKEGIHRLYRSSFVSEADVKEITYKEFESFVKEVIEYILKKYKDAYEKELRNI